ncbi:hypothetical protein Efla_002227 [Eimeria flavescens]
MALTTRRIGRQALICMEACMHAGLDVDNACFCFLVADAELRSHLQREGRVWKEDCLEIVRKVAEVVSNEPNLLRLNDPITVVGDIHGQYYDLLKLLDVGGDPDTTQYLFLGDYVDRGSFSVEVLLLLFAIKLTHPSRVWLLRGNHECRQMTSFFNFRDECECKYDMSVYYAFMERKAEESAFDALPLAAVINGKFLAVHGGLSPELKVLSQIGGINRFQEPPRGGLFCDLLWADPLDESREDQGMQLVAGGEGAFFPNDVRGCSYFFAYTAASTFLDRNGLLSVLRAHEAQLEGYKMHQTNSKTGFPTVITIFSAPNYCDVYNNKGAVLKFENNTLNIQQFNFSPHPYHLPNFMDVFTWSIPFVSEKVTEMLYGILNPSVEDGEDDEEIDSVELPAEVVKIMHANIVLAEEGTSQRSRPPSAGTPISKERAEALRRKVQSVGRLMRVFKTIREENELIMQLKGCTPGDRIPVGLLIQGREGLANELEKFQKAKQIDAMNERRPDAAPKR